MPVFDAASSSSKSTNGRRQSALGRTLATGRGGNAGFAIQCLGNNPGQSGLTYAARSGKQVGAMQALFFQCIGKGLNRVPLPTSEASFSAAICGPVLDRS